jgi:hypothetical protein
MISLYTTFVPACRQMIDAVGGVLTKSEAFAAERGIDPAMLVDARLIPDMLPLAYQVQSLMTHSTRALDGVRAGSFSPLRAAFPADFAADFAAMHALLAETEATLAAVAPAEVDALVGGDMAFVMGEYRVAYTAEDFLLSFSLPNIYFHATTAYGILRAAGVPLGKRDFLGRPRIKG